MTTTRSQARAAIRTRLEARRPEFEQAILTRVHGMSDSSDADLSYLEGLRAAVSTALDYALAAIKFPDREDDPVPVQLLSQARLAARSGVSLDTVLRRYAAGHSLLADILFEEADAGGIAAAELRTAHRALASRFDRVVAAVGDEYSREENAYPKHPGRRRAEFLRRLLAGEPLDPSDLSYDFTANHLALVASGPGGAEALRKLAEQLDRRLLLAEPDERIAWAWLGGRRCFDERERDFLVSIDWPDQVAIGCGEPGRDLPGWRLTHRQAVATLSIARRGKRPFVSYGEDPLLVSLLQDDLLATSLREIYLTPLERARGGGRTALTTLRAYLAADRNVSSAAAALGVKRHTVTRRLRIIEELIGHSLSTCASEIDVVLRLKELDGSRSSRTAVPSA